MNGTYIYNMNGTYIFQSYTWEEPINHYTVIIAAHLLSKFFYKSLLRAITVEHEVESKAEKRK